MEILLQNWEVWVIAGGIQIMTLVVGHFVIREKYLNYWLAGLIGVSTWLLPLLVVSSILGLDPRPILLLLATATATFGGVGLEAIVRRGMVLSIVFHTLVVLAIGLIPGLLIAWIALVPPGPGWIPQLVVSGVSAVVCGIATVGLHYYDIVAGLDIYRRNGLTPGEHRTIADAMFIINRKVRPHIGDVYARMRRASEALSAGLANVESINAFLDLVVTMLEATVEDSDEAFLTTLSRNVEVDLRQTVNSK